MTRTSKRKENIATEWKPRSVVVMVFVILASLGIFGIIYRVVQKKGTGLLSTSLAWPAVAGCSQAETFSQLSSISFAQPCNPILSVDMKKTFNNEEETLETTFAAPNEALSNGSGSRLTLLGEAELRLSRGRIPKVFERSELV